ncbi:DUF861 domain-containing protein [Rhodobacteraceae bacterium 2CG4]|uniref:DUF861 domain-containing protein n=1 Tax=Halovulum marinum TaxID=2662447 RepID=A0A6L5YXK0_9RHOB|nr:cupin domain-containing protein [Halovulum marinum]MSU88582.1 DUF861 domain-containing protein [Halovulum marinum]
MGVQVIRAAAVRMRHRGGPPGLAQVGRAVSSALSPGMGAGLAAFDGCSVAWTLQYDEVIYVIAGELTITADGVTHVAEPGDVVWIPEGTSLIYGGRAARIFYAVQPGNWAERSAE